MTQQDGNNAIVVTKVESGLAVLGGADAMKEALKHAGECRGVIKEYISDNFIKDIDWGPTDPRSDKPTLKKPGAEKICSLFDTRPTWERDSDTWEMLGSPSGTVCFICRIVSNATGNIVGEGRGAAKVGEKGRDANKAIKIAEKCALVDAALYTFNLSELFTQDDVPKGGGPAAGVDINAEKWQLLQSISEWRRGCESPMTDQQFIVAVCERELHAKTAKTVGEVEHIRKVILIDHLYTPETAERLPDGPPSEYGEV